MEKSNIGSAQNIGQFLIVEDGSDPPLRMNDLLSFFSAKKRSTKCPCCDWIGGWEIATHEENPEEENPKLDIITLAGSNGPALSTAGMTCPNCGHFTQVSTYKIRQHMLTKVWP